MINSWSDFLDQQKSKKYFIELLDKLNQARKKATVYPLEEDLFSCFELCSYDNLKVVIIGQDPYHGENQAHGLSFSVKPGVKIPPSLKNIYKELQNDLGVTHPNHGYLAAWAKQGVLLMNTIWSVEAGKAGSHKKLGWESFTKNLLTLLNDYEKPLVFILWGNHAIDVAKAVTKPQHFLLKGVHPSPLSANKGFFGSKPFSKTNDFLIKAGRGAIDWA